MIPKSIAYRLILCCIELVKSSDGDRIDIPANHGSGIVDAVSRVEVKKQNGFKVYRWAGTDYHILSDLFFDWLFNYSVGD